MPEDRDPKPRFDPARDGPGFRNPVGVLPNRASRGFGGAFLVRYDRFVYGDGLCFGMAAYTLNRFVRGGASSDELPLSPEVLEEIRKLHGRQMVPRAVLTVVLGWLRDRGGRPDLALKRLRLPGENTDPHVLCFGPLGLGREFFRVMREAHAVVPYRMEGDCLYVYDPNYPKDRGRYLMLRRDGTGKVTGFAYGSFRSEEGWGLALLPLSAVGGAGAARPGAVARILLLARRSAGRTPGLRRR
jgi:hypothetical protein